MIDYNWTQVARLLLTSRALDRMEEDELVPSGEITYQFSAGGHELVQILLAMALDHPHDAATVYYRSRPFMMGVGLTPAESLASTMAREGGISAGRDIGVVFNRPSSGGVTVLPMSGDVGTQYTPAVGWAQAIRYRADTLNHDAWRGAIAVAMGGDGSTATGGFWAALTIATTLKLPMLFVVEDNEFAISVRSHLQTPGLNIAKNLAAFTDLTVLDGDGTDPAAAAAHISTAVLEVRDGRGPVLLRMRVPRLPGHSVTDNQFYKSADERAEEASRDPLTRLREWLVPAHLSEDEWDELAQDARHTVEQARDEVRERAEPALGSASSHLFFEGVAPQQGGLLPETAAPMAETSATADPDSEPIALVPAVRRTLAIELATNPRLLLFGEDVGYKGGVHTVTEGLQGEFGEARVFDTSLNEEGIIGRAMGMALAGLFPVPEIQFRKYLDPATEQINDTGTIRWRTANRFAAPMVVRIPVGFASRTGDPWHSVSDESVLAHKPGWRVAFPSNAADAVGLLRTALRGDDPTFFLEHRNLLFSLREAGAPYPGDNYALPFGHARIVRPGRDLTVVTWGAMVPRCEQAARALGESVELIDLRTLVPWDRDAVLNSVKKTARCLVIHEDGPLASFSGDIIALIADEGFAWLDAPVQRLTGPLYPIPYNKRLMDEVVPTVERIRNAMESLLEF
ncbi:MAG: dehydrogenase E1 component subunit alpha/beta [Anaerolineales bacterium]|nr:dehydrogenase E1 component subunit alpha/beta [Anaerolineales bacterium]MCB9129035.1 pyruvate dehydrogenase [Ardenticatenales bacterium]MCB9172478.1 pyruvate dehydrogenase [Ardenticatenales bacterium]